MNPPSTAIPFTRFIAIDMHKHYAVVGWVNAQQQVILPPRRVEIDELATWTQKYLLSTDEVVLEATTNAWTTYDRTQGSALCGCQSVTRPLDCRSAGQN